MMHVIILIIVNVIIISKIVFALRVTNNIIK